MYGALPGCELPSASSGDIRRDSLPAPVLEVTLEVGDVLFIPRGHVHEAVALAEGSAHVTVSAYQHWTWMQMATSVLKGCNVRPLLCDILAEQYPEITASEFTSVLRTVCRASLNS